jgi:glycosyltransferase involved in cell wall biosynthesis
MARLVATVVTPCLNMGAYLAETIESVLANLRSGDEFFIVDGGSTDQSVEIIRRYEKRLSGWVSEPDRGYADAIAKGFRRGRGDFLCWINAGDIQLSGALDAAADTLERTRADLIFGDDFYIDERSRVIRFSRGYVADLREAMLFGGWTPLQDACFWRRGLYENIGGIDVAMKFAADFDLFLRMTLAGHCLYVPVAFSAFRRHAGQKSIAGAGKYKRERGEARRRALQRMPGSRAGHALRSAVRQAGVRWRVHVRQRAWHRHDLAGRRIDELVCGSYWPRTPA